MSGRDRVGAALSAALLAATATGCLDRYEPDVGPPLGPLCRDIDSDPGFDVSFGLDIRPLFGRDDARCLDCHTPGGTSPLGLRVSGLNLSSYTSLIRGGVDSGDAIVLPERPCASILYQKVSEAPPYGGRMPLDGPPFFDDRDLQLIADWIAEGADDD